MTKPNPLQEQAELLDEQNHAKDLQRRANDANVAYVEHRAKAWKAWAIIVEIILFLIVVGILTAFVSLLHRGLTAFIEAVAG